ncbi:MAG: UvrD-helicase domain-containing protein [Acidobacteria bacterium]|nr:UvrD-helicase domain-containing protein [Acidobacteriota bacterium]
MMNEAQRAAVERWGQDVCVVAGPGSGKTRVLIERFRWLVAHKGIDPRRILAVTFTEKAATEIKRRLIDSFSASEALREQIERAWVSTIHGFCTRLLKENAIAAAVDPNFGLIDEAESKFLGRIAAEAVLDDLLVLRPDAMRTLLIQLNTGIEDLAGALLKLYEEARTAGVDIDTLQPPPLPQTENWNAIVSRARVALQDPPAGTFSQRDKHQYMHRWADRVLQTPAGAPFAERLQLLREMPKASSLKSGSRVRAIAQELEEHVIPETEAAIILTARHFTYPVLLEALRRIHLSYSAEKRQRGVLDFEDLQEFTIRLLESNEAIRQRVRASFDQVLMDELQDTNQLQWRLVDLVRSPGALFAVGDINQSIYYFRHADPEVFRGYRDSLVHRGDFVDELRENYRSRAEIIAAINAVVPFLPGGIEPHRLVARREYPPKSQPSIELMHAFAANPDDSAARIEALWIARRIRELEGNLPVGKEGEQRPARFSDFAILARTIGGLTPVQEALDEFGVPSTISGGKSFYETREVRDLVAWLRVLANPLDEISLVVVLRSPLVGAGDETLLRLKMQSADSDKGLFTAIETEPSLEWFHQLVTRQRARAHMLPPDVLLAQVIDQSGYDHNLPSRARANVAKLQTMLRDWHARDPRTIGELCDELRNWRDTGAEAEAASGEAGNAVRLMTVHAAKGLEFPIVFVASMRTGGQNREPVFCFNAQRHIGVTWRHPTGGVGISDPVHLAVCDQKRRQEAGEEDRLLYVAITRAEEHLVLSAGLPGKLPWMRIVCDATGLPANSPKQELAATHHTIEGIAIAVTHTAQPAPNDLPAPSTAPIESVTYTDPPPISGQYESVAPVTSVAQHAFCPRQYYLARYLRYPAATSSTPPPSADPEPDRSEWTASEFGTMVHELLAGKLVADAPLEAQSMAQGFASSPLGQRVQRATRVGREYDFLIEVEGVILRGQIDLWFQENGEIILLDYKSDRVEPGEERLHSFRYGPQLRLYAIALQRLTGKMPRRAIVWYLRTGIAIDISLREEWIDAARQQVAALRAAQDTMTFPLREGPHCQRCAFVNGVCPARTT